MWVWTWGAACEGGDCEGGDLGLYVRLNCGTEWVVGGGVVGARSCFTMWFGEGPARKISVYITEH